MALETPETSQFAAEQDDKGAITQFLTGALAEVATNDDFVRSKFLAGPNHGHVNAILGQISARLAEIHPELGPDVFAGDTYKHPKTIELLEELPTAIKEEVAELKRFKRESMFAVGRLMHDILPTHDLPEGLLTIPKYCRQRRGEECVIGAFDMVLGDLIGEPLPQDAVRNAAINSGLVRPPRTSGRSVKLDDNDLTGIFYTDTFKQKHPNRVEAFSFAGFGLDTVGQLAVKLRERMGAEKVYVVLSLDSSNSTWSTTITHRVVLLGAEADYAVVHDPRPDNRGGANKQERADYFYTRWAQGYFGGYMVAELPKKN